MATGHGHSVVLLGMSMLQVLGSDAPGCLVVRISLSTSMLNEAVKVHA